jgi:hypothetical protein
MKDYHLEFITPAFCAGADQSKAEIRVPSIRGQVRWWFRVLGGTPEQERRVFGGVHGTPARSAVMLRVTDVKATSNERDLPTWHNPRESPLAYLGYFATVSGEGRRYKAGAFFSPGTSFRLLVRRCGPLERQDEALFEEALAAWTRLGVLGMRGTRAFGALRDCGERLTAEQFLAWGHTLPNVRVKAEGSPCQGWLAAMSALGSFLKALRRDQHLSGREPSVLGTSRPRQSSALALRPVSVAEGILPVVFYTNRALPRDCRAGRDAVEGLFQPQ